MKKAEQDEKYLTALGAVLSVTAAVCSHTDELRQLVDNCRLPEHSDPPRLKRGTALEISPKKPRNRRTKPFPRTYPWIPARDPLPDRLIFKEQSDDLFFRCHSRLGLPTADARSPNDQDSQRTFSHGPLDSRPIHQRRPPN